MKIDAHPLVVAVALGLLGPGVLMERGEEGDDPFTGCGGSEDPCSDDRDTRLEWEPGETPDPEEFHRVEIEWLKLTS